MEMRTAYTMRVYVNNTFDGDTNVSYYVVMHR